MQIRKGSMGLAEEGQNAEQILNQLAAFKQHDVAWRNGRVFAFVFNAGQDAEALVKQAHAMYLSENALDPTSFLSTLHLEREIVRQTASLMQGDNQVVGNVTSGGTESIMLAVKTARDWARAQRPEIKEPEMILCRTAHAAFHKAAHYLGLKPVVVPFEQDSFKANVGAMREAINESTILLVASAPNYSHGIVDPVPEIAALAADNNLLCHVDACIGGIQLAFMRQLGYEVPPFDFAVPGVFSLSVIAETRTLDQLDPVIVRQQVEALLEGLTTEEAAQALYQLAGMEDGSLPEEMAFVNTVLDALPPQIAEYMLREFFNDLYV